MSKSLRHDLTVQMVKVEDLVPWERNPRHNDAAAERLAYTIQEQGWTTPILVQRESGRIIGGHTRLKAAMKIGLTEVPVIHLDVEDRQADAIAIADNRLGEIAEWDNDELARLLEEIEADGGDLLAIGYNDADWAELLDSLDEEGAFDELPGDVEPEEPPEEPVSRLGEVYELGPHRLVCGSSLDADTVDSLGPFGAVVADPPYGTGINTEKGLGNSSVPMALIGDENPDLARSAFRSLSGVSDVQVWWGANYYADALPGSPCWAVWDKDHHGMTFADAELAYVSSRGPVRVFRHAWSGNHRASERGVERQHPTQKPIALYEWVLEMWVPERAVVLDPFGGSGSTLLACARTGRHARLIELDPGYCDVIRKRWTKWAREAGQDPGPGALD
jgi:16S rRNA G966 N2-methylase RsmD